MLSERWPELAIDPSTFQSRLYELYDAAVGFGIESKRGVLRYMEIGLFYGVDFPKSPKWSWALDILQSPVPEGDHKIGLIDERLCGAALW
jgi:hypothetical protein